MGSGDRWAEALGTAEGSWAGQAPASPDDRWHVDCCASARTAEKGIDLEMCLVFLS